MAVVRKVQSKVNITEEKEKPLKEEGKKVVEKEVVQDNFSRDGESIRTPFRSSKKVCQFCKTSSAPRYWDAAALRRYLNDRGRIAGRMRSGCCAKHQRRVAQEVKRARHLALLPFTVRV